MKSLCILALLPCFLFGWSTQDTFNTHLNLHFVETGTWVGEGVDKALYAGFPHIHSIELSEQWYEYCKTKFANVANVDLWQGDSSVVLAQVISGINEPITFWLDGHYSGYPTAQGDENCPILQELEAIKNHPIKEHTILIDDVRLFGTAEFGFITLAEVQSKLLEINENYELSFQDGYQANDILVAKVRSN